MFGGKGMCDYNRFYIKCQNYPIGTASAISLESDLGCTPRVYFDNVIADVAETMPNTITSVNGNDIPQ